MHNWMEMAPGIFSVREKSHRFGQPSTNIYYVPDGNGGGLLYDAGYAMPRSFNDFMFGFRSLVAQLKREGRIPGNARFSELITTAIISHEHHDHSSGATMIRRYFPRVKIIASNETAVLIQRQGKTNKKPADLLEGLLMALFYRIVHARHPIHVDQVIADHDTITCGDRRFTVILAPGHSPGQVLLHEPASGILLASDLLLQDISTWLGPPHSDYTAYHDSMICIAKLDPLLALPAHGGPVRNPRDRVLELLSFRRLREEQIIRICAEHPKTAGDIAWHIYRGRGLATLFAAKGMIDLVLAHLVAVGRLKRIVHGMRVKYSPA